MKKNINTYSILGVALGVVIYFTVHYTLTSDVLLKIINKLNQTIL